MVGSRGFTGVGVAATLIGLVVFALMLQGILDTSAYYPLHFSPYDSNYSIYFTVNQSLPIFGPLTQMLGGGFWFGALGGILGLIGISGMKK